MNRALEAKCRLAWEKRCSKTRCWECDAAKKLCGKRLPNEVATALKFEVVAHSKLKNQEVLMLLACQQGAKGTVKTRPCQTLAAKTSSSGSSATAPIRTLKDLFGGKPSTTATADNFAEGSAWKAKKAKKEPVSDLPVKVLIQDGWSAPVVQTFEDFRRLTRESVQPRAARQKRRSASCAREKGC